MERLEVVEKVQRLSQHFLKSIKDLEDMIASNNLIFSLDHIEAEVVTERVLQTILCRKA